MIGRRDFLVGAGALATAGPLSAATPGGNVLYDRAVVIDALGGPGGYDPKYRGGDPMLPRFVADAKASGLTAVNVTVSAVGNVPTGFDDTVAEIAAMNREIERHPDVFMAVRRGADLQAAKSGGRLGIIYGMQDSMPFGADFPSRLRTLDNLGVRIVQPTYNVRNLFGDGCLEPANGGLSRLGRDLVAALNERRILVDGAHAGSRAQAECIALSRAPIAISHTGCRAVRDHPRNTPDAELKALANQGGVAGIYLMPYLSQTGAQPTHEDVIRHIEHAWQVAGEDHVGLGTDNSITGVQLTPEYRAMFERQSQARLKAGYAAPGDENTKGYLFAARYNDPRRFETLAGDLLARGHAPARIEKLLGANFARLFAEVWG